MILIINGEEKNVRAKNLADLLDFLGLNKDAIAIELNKSIIHRQEFDNTKLKGNDKLEIITVVGGG